jgi:hypothetical protein
MPPTNYSSKFTFGLENTAGTPVKGQVEMDLISESIRGTGAPTRRRGITGFRSPKGVVPGPYEVGGSFLVEAVPTNLAKPLLSMFDLITTDEGPFIHTFSTVNTLRPFTAQVKRGDYYFVYPGLFMESVTFRASYGNIVEAEFAVGGIGKERVYTVENSEVGMISTSDDPFNFDEATVTLNGATNTDTDNWEVTVSTGLTLTRGLGVERTPNRAFPGDSLVRGSFDLLFMTDAKHKEFLGETSGSRPFTAKSNVVDFSIILSFTSGAKILTINLPKLHYVDSGMAITGREGVIRQPLSFEGTWDSVTGTDIVIQLVNAQTGEAEAALGTNIA